MTKDNSGQEAFMMKSKIDYMNNLVTIREVRSGYCWTKRHKKCKHTSKACHCTCHSIRFCKVFVGFCACKKASGKKCGVNCYYANVNYLDSQMLIMIQTIDEKGKNMENTDKVTPNEWNAMTEDLLKLSSKIQTFKKTST